MTRPGYQGITNQQGVLGLQQKSVSLFVLALVLLASAFPVSAQVLYGTVVGLAEDPSGAAIPNAEVTLTNKATAQVYTDKTDGAGRYNIANVQPGNYDARITSQGFKTQTRTDVLVEANVVTRVDAKLEVGSLSEQVTVQGEATLLQTDKSDTHSVITTQQVTNMPLGGYRNYQTLINLVPGATPAQFQNSKTDTPGRALQTHINGTNAQNNVTRIDGAASINIWLPHHVGYVAPAETIEAVNITTTAPDAEQGMAGGAAVALVTKSGTNQFHGSLFEFHNNQHLNARNFFATSKPLSIYNNYGTTLGGPIIHNKLFFFGSWDSTRERAGAVLTAESVPTADQRLGDFSAFLPGTGKACLALAVNCAVIYDPATGNPDGTGRTPFPGNMIPGNRISTAAQKIQGYLPLPNQAGYAGNFAIGGTPALNRDFVDAKLNWNPNDRHQIYVKYGRMWATVSGQPEFGPAGGNAPGADPGTGDTTINNGSLGHTFTLSPSLLLDGLIGYQRQDQQVTGSDFGTNFGQVLGIPGLNGPDIRQSGFPNVSFGLNNTGIPNWMPLFRVEETFTTSHNLTWTKGAHEFRFGFDGLLLRLNHWQPELSNGGPRGYIGFDGTVTGLKGGSLTPNQFNTYAAFLLGLPSEYDKGVQNILMTGREWQFGFYARDRWQVSRKLTLSLGLRYEYYPLMTRSNGKGLERYDPATNLVYLGGRGNVPRDAGISIKSKFFAPRVGFAYRLTEKTVLRAGYGLSPDPLPFSRPLRGFYPLTIDQDTVTQQPYQYLSPLSVGLPPVATPDLTTGIIPLPNGVSERSPVSNLHRGYTQSWNFTVEHRLPSDIVAGVAYVGTQSTHMLADRDINSGFPGSGNSGRPYFIKYGNTSAINMWDGYLSANYHSLQTSITKNFSHGLLVKGAYTWSKAMNMTDDDGWASVGWNWGPVFRRNYAPAGYDRTHIFQVGWVYQLPAGPGHKYFSSGPVGYVLGGWEVDGAVSAYTGTPFTVSAPNGSTVNAPSNTQTADQVKTTVDRPGNVGPGTYYFDPTAFAVPTGVRFGSSGRNILRNPGVFNTNASLVRNFRIKERATLSFRSEFYNLPNTSHFNGVASGSVTSSNFMRILSSYGERQVRFGLRLGF